MSIAIPSLRGAIAVPGWAKNELWRRARAVPSLDLRFAENRSLVDATTGLNLITFSRTSDATFVGSNGVIQTASAGTPRFDHSPITGESLGLLVEEQRTNLLLQSEDFSTTWTTVRASITANSISSPSATLTAGRLVDTAENNTHVVSQTVTLVDSLSYSFSVYVKADQLSIVRLQAINKAGTACLAYFDLLTGTVSNESNATGLITPMQGGWYRCIIVFNSATGATAQQVLISPAKTAGVSFYLGNGTDGIYLWGAQLEVGAFPTSYIPTGASVVTRAADVCSISGSNWSSWASNNNGTFFSDSLIIATSIQTQGVWQMAGGSNSTSLRQPHATANQFRAVVGGTFSPSPGTGAALSAGATKAAVAYSGATGRLQVAGDGSDVTGNNLDANRLDIGNISGGSYLNGHIRRLVFWRERLANNVLQSITQ